MSLVTRLAGVLAALAASAALAPTAHALPDGFEEITLAEGLTQPTAVAFAPASDGRMFIAEQPGIVKVRTPDGAVTQLLDWRDKVNSAWDRGLIGIAADTDFATYPYVYIVFVADDPKILDGDDQGPHSSRLVRLTVSPTNEVTATKSLVGGDADQGACPPSDGVHSTLDDAEIDCIPASAIYHSIGTVVSDPRDGTIWFGSGDATDVANTASARRERLGTYNEESFAGKLMHIDREGRGLAGHAFCRGPGDVDADLDRTCTKIHAKGFRNPFRFTIPKTPGGLPIVGDVGSDRREELNFAVPGGNYGWPCWEGSNQRPTGTSTYAGCGPWVLNGTPNNVLPPAFEYDHGGEDAAILAGPVYTGSGYPAEYAGNLFFGDYARGIVRRFSAGTAPGTFAIAPTLIPSFSVQNSSILFTQRAALTQLTEAPNGDLVVVDFLTGADYSGPGRVVRISHAPGNRSPVAVAKVADEEIDPGDTAQLDARDSSDPDGDPLSYFWDFDDDGSVDSTDATPTWTFPADAAKRAYTAKLTVDDGRGRTNTRTVQVLVGVHRPRVTITAPAADSLYDGGQQLSLSGDATDEDQLEPFPAENLRWEIRLIHGGHLHPHADISGRSGAFTAFQDHGLDSHYRIRLIATDASGIEGSATVTVYPRPADLRLESSPAGAPIEVDDEAFVAPRNVASAVGLRSTVRAAADFVRDGRTWRFARWSDGVPTRERDYLVPAGGGGVTALYEADPISSGPGAGTAPGTTPGAGSSGTPTPPRAARPRLVLGSPWAKGRRTARSIGGTLTGADARPTVQVALARAAGTRCRWWSARTRRFGRAGSCRTPVWTTASVRRTATGWRFDARLGTTVARRAGRIHARARSGGRTVAQVTIGVTSAR